MDASAYLRRQGWRGDGHSLDHTDRGIRKPLLIGKKVDVLGVGSNKHAAVSDQWWLRAFDQGLKSFGTGEETVLASVQKHGINRGGLYGRFVKGERIEGSIGQEIETSTPSSQSEDSTSDGMAHKQTTDRKRKLKERPAEVRAREKAETSAKARQGAIDWREQGIADGTGDYEKEAEARKKQKIDHRAKEILAEAEMRGLVSPRRPRLGERPAAHRAETATIPDQTGVQHAFDQIDPDAQASAQAPKRLSYKAQQYAREKVKREVKRAARAELTGEQPSQPQSKGAKKRAKRLEEKLQRQQEYQQAAADHAVIDTIGNMAPEKLEEYQRRAIEKSMLLEHYIRRRHEKAFAKKVAKMEIAGTRNGLQPELLGTTQNDVQPRDTDPDQCSPPNGLGFVIDTEGDDHLVDDSQPPPYQTRPVGLPAVRIASDTKGKDIFTDVGIVKKNSSKKMSRAEQKVEARESLVKQILWHSRQALRDGRELPQVATIGAVENVPLIKVASHQGLFSKAEIKLARSSARRVMRQVKRMDREKKGKGKGYKKKERAARQAAKNAALAAKA